MRILPLDSIPQVLWEDNKLFIPEELKVAYSTQLDELGALEDAIIGKPKNKAIHGGAADEETIEHFAYRFPASSGRIEYVAISPCEELVNVSDAIINTFSGGEVSVLDIPGGTGAAMCSLLTTLAVLRSEKIIPMLPLSVQIMCGDLSPKAIEIYGEMIIKLSPQLEEYGISVQFESMNWDATRNDHTAQLLDAWFAMSSDNAEYLVCVSNFTGALIGAKIFDDFAPCLNQVMARLGDKKSTLLWVEPSTKNTNQLRKKLSHLFSVSIKWFISPDDSVSPLLSEYVMRNPLNDTEHRSSVHVQRFERK